MFKLPEHVSEKYIAARNELNAKRAVFANLDNGDLVASARFWMAHCAAPRQHEPNSPVYDSTFWHIIVPELLNRIGRLDAAARSVQHDGRNATD